MIEQLYHQFTKTPLVTTDSRNTPPGSIFFALKGENFDGNRFAKNALDAGAALAVIDNPDHFTEGCLLVDNALEALQQLANYHRKRLGTRVIGITGSNGKTTTKELLVAVLSARYSVYATQGNLNNHIGVPLTILSLTRENEIAVVEMGANHPGDIKELAEIAEPNFGIITNIGRAHLGGFGSFEGVIATKSELYGFIERCGGEVFYNQSNPILCDLVSRYGLDTRAVPYSSICLHHTVVNNPSSPFLTLRVDLAEDTVEIRSNLVGSYNAENLLAAIAVGRHFGIGVSAIKEAVEAYSPANNRSQLLRTTKNTVIMDAYNANPSSMDAAIRNFAASGLANKMLIVGEMLELGEYATEEHRKVVELLELLGLRDVLLVGEGYRDVHGRFPAFAGPDECLDFLRGQGLANRTILLKGSRGVKLERLLEVL